jgi:hypothetical protein
LALGKLVALAGGPAAGGDFQHQGVVKSVLTRIEVGVSPVGAQLLVALCQHLACAQVDARTAGFLAGDVDDLFVGILVTFLELRINTSSLSRFSSGVRSATGFPGMCNSRNSRRPASIEMSLRCVPQMTSFFRFFNLATDERLPIWALQSASSAST